jgi:large subunit ribosomal protein L22
LSPRAPSDPEQGTPAEEPEVEADAPGAAQAGEDAAQPEPRAKRRRGPAKPRVRRSSKAAAGEQAGADPESGKQAPAGKEPEAGRERARARQPRAAKPPASAPRESGEQPAAPASSSRRSGRGAQPAARRRVVRARARYVRTSARKARMVCAHLRGKSVADARAILAFTPREAARDWSKLLESAVANAETNHELLEDDLVVREAYADEGPTIKRFRPRAMGRATPIRKRTSHLTIALSAGPESKRGKRAG